MLNIPVLARAFSWMLLAVGLWLAGENTLISADVLSSQSGASVVASSAIAITATALELVFASWFLREKSLAAATSKFRDSPGPMFIRLVGVGIGLALVYHFDILTTKLHPRFLSDDLYFFSCVVGAFIFGPEACILVSRWIWVKARDIETEQMKENNHKDADNEYQKSKREQMRLLGREFGVAAANDYAAKRWGQRPSSDLSQHPLS